MSAYIKDSILLRNLMAQEAFDPIEFYAKWNALEINLTCHSDLEGAIEYLTNLKFKMEKEDKALDVIKSSEGKSSHSDNGEGTILEYGGRVINPDSNAKVIEKPNEQVNLKRTW